MMKTIITFLLFSLVATQAIGQWDQYEAVWRGKPGKMLVNMDAISLSPIAELPFLLEVTQRSLQCDEQGYPTQRELIKSDESAIIIDSLLSKKTYVKNVGRLTYQCDIKDYYYLQDTLSVKKTLQPYLSANSKYKIIDDPEWKVYEDFIYPDDYLIQTMDNSKIIKVLRREGIDLESKTMLTHYASFASDVDRNKFRRFLIEQNFKVEEQQHDESNPLPYLITFSRNDNLQLEQLSNITLRIFQRSKSLNGVYDGWEIEL